MKRLLLIDANNRFLSCYVKNPSMSADGSPVGGIDGFLKSLNKLVRETNPTKIIVVWDAIDGQTKRKKKDQNYKGNRTRASLNRHFDGLDDLQKEHNRTWQQLKLIELLNLLPISQICIDNLEADDVIAFVCNSFKQHQKVVVSSDKDFFQLLDNTTIILRPTQKEILNKDDVIEKWQIHPNNIALARAIEGDSSDNLSGVEGVGIKTVAKCFKTLLCESKMMPNELFEICKVESQKKKASIAYQKILDAEDIVRHNFEMMQLEVTNIALQNQRYIQEVVEQKDVGFNQFLFMTTLTEMGIGDEPYLTGLLQRMRQMSLRKS